MDVSSGNLRILLLMAPKMDEEFYGIFFYLLQCTEWRERERETRMMGDKEDGVWSRL